MPIVKVFFYAVAAHYAVRLWNAPEATLEDMAAASQSVSSTLANPTLQRHVAHGIHATRDYVQDPSFKETIKETWRRGLSGMASFSGKTG